MTVESNYATAIASLGDWLKNLKPAFQPIRSKTKTNCTLYMWFFPGFEQVTGSCYKFCFVHQAVFSCCDWSERLLWCWFFDSPLKTTILLALLLLFLSSSSSSSSFCCMQYLSSRKWCHFGPSGYQDIFGLNDFCASIFFVYCYLIILNKQHYL